MKDKWTRRLLAVLLAALLLCGLLPAATIGASAAAGDFIVPVTRLTTAPAGYTEIRTAQDLNNIRNNLSGKYILMSDIDLSGWGNWVPIGDSTTSFMGTVDGNGYEIVGLTIVKSDNGDFGLIGRAKDGGIVNLGFRDTNININALDSAKDCNVGAAIGYATYAELKSKVILQNCYQTGKVSSDKNTGGLLGGANVYTAGSVEITNCYNTGNITSNNTAAGIAGYVSGTIHIEGCYNTGNISALRYAAGIVGQCSNTTIGSLKRCYNSGPISIVTNASPAIGRGGVADAGGIVAASSGSNIENCFNRGNVSIISTGSNKPSSSAGGIAGTFNYNTIINCYNSGLVEISSTDTGGYIGYGSINGAGAGGINTCYWLEQGISPTGGGSGSITASSALTDTQMRQQASFAGFDFATIWAMPAGGGYPVLQVQSAPATYTLTLNANGGNVTPPTVTQATGTTYTLPIPTRSGFSFAGWTLSGGGSLSGSTYTFGTSNGTVTAQWTAVITNSTLTLNANGGSVTPTSVTQAAGTSYNLPTPTRSGYTFTGWTLSGSGSQSGNTYTFGTSNGTVTAQWKQNKGIFGTNAKWYGEWWHYLLFFFCFGFIWMWF